MLTKLFYKLQEKNYIHYRNSLTFWGGKNAYSLSFWELDKHAHVCTYLAGALQPVSNKTENREAANVPLLNGNQLTYCWTAPPPGSQEMGGE